MAIKKFIFYPTVSQFMITMGVKPIQCSRIQHACVSYSYCHVIQTMAVSYTDARQYLLPSKLVFLHPFDLSQMIEKTRRTQFPMTFSEKYRDLAQMS